MEAGPGWAGQAWSGVRHILRVSPELGVNISVAVAGRPDDGALCNQTATEGIHAAGGGFRRNGNSPLPEQGAVTVQPAFQEGMVTNDCTANPAG